MNGLKPFSRQVEFFNLYLDVKANYFLLTQLSTISSPNIACNREMFATAQSCISIEVTCYMGINSCERFLDNANPGKG